MRAAGSGFGKEPAGRRRTIAPQHGKGSTASSEKRDRTGRAAALPPRQPAAPRPSFPELLAPAGSPEAYFAAVSSGADAVYLGLSRYNARERAENFTLADLCRILPHARARGVRVYLAMNALLTEADLPEAIALLHQVEPLSPDAVIVADLGLLKILRRFFPGLPVHVSTQAGCASSAAAFEFARLGASRVILERHLRFPEVRQIVSRSPIGVEIFVHGSMCYSFSGKCLFSSYLGGKSGNRGACVQPCRRVYGFPGGEGAVFSTRDLSLIEHLPELVPLGFAAFKIEGRMRGADSVGGVVAAYRAALDGIRNGRPREGVEEGRRLLASVIGREETPGLLGGAEAGAVASGGSTGNMGELLGTVRGVRNGWATITEAPPVVRGDRLRVQFRADGSGRGFTALETRMGPEGFSVKVPFPLEPGDLLLRTGGGGRMDLTRRARREMEALPPGGVAFRVRVGDNAVSVAASYGAVRKEYSFRVAGAGGGGGGIPPDAAQRLRALCRIDLPPGEVAVEDRGGAVRWDDVGKLFARAARMFDKEFHLAGKERRLAVLPALRVVGSRTETLPALFFVACRAYQLGLLPRDPAIVPVVEFTRALARDPVAPTGTSRDRVWLRLPPPLLESDSAFFRRTVDEAARKGFRRWVVSDVGHFRLLAAAGARRDLTIMSDQSLSAFNTGTLSVLSRLGASRMVLPAEAPLETLRAVGKYLYGMGVAYAYGAVPLMTSRLLPASGARGVVVSRRRETFHVETDDRGSIVRPEQPFSASGVLHEIRAAGIQDFYVDLFGVEDDAVAGILDALFADRGIPGTTTFNLFRGNF
ncbi:MAG: U32 family peptidase [Deltaproteobacteria bacterium]|nr:U32 family peptidase [Deltaproteobacteria bacterium]